MIDDGLLVNFDLKEQPLRVKPVFRGGRWKDRLHAKKSLSHIKAVPAIPNTSNRNGDDGAKQNGNPETPDGDIVDAIPRKRHKANHADYTANRLSQQIESQKPVIASLFTSNPSRVKPSEDDNKQDETTGAVEPSNAPLPEEVSQFTSIGLDTTLAEHLYKNLSFKAPTAIQRAAISQLLKEDSDAFIQAETGSGKTLAYLLPIVQRLISLEDTAATGSYKDQSAGGVTNLAKRHNHIHRGSGLFALILVPTRELAQQVNRSLEQLLRRTPNIVAGIVSGGATKNHEKARIRKGVNILVATPGRLVDHLENTETLDIKQVRWLVLDEGDRLVELGFEDDVRKIVEALEGKTSLSKNNRIMSRHNSGFQSIVNLPKRRTTVLCSATMKMGVQKLGEISLKEASLITADTMSSKVDNKANKAQDITMSTKGDTGEENFLAPAQLKQSYIIAPAKQRLVTLAALLRHSFARRGTSSKAVVFMSCADSVDYHFDLFGRSFDTASDHDTRQGQDESAPAKDAQKSPTTHLTNDKVNGSSRTTSGISTIAKAPCLTSSCNLGLSLYKLHGTLPQASRNTTLQRFSKTSDPSIMICTDVAARGLDLPDIDLVIEYDPAFSSDDHIHRIGRTARAGRMGRAICFLMPGAEEGYIEILNSASGRSMMKAESAEEVLRKGFSTSFKVANEVEEPKERPAVVHRRWDERATDWQLAIERLVLEDSVLEEMARRAYISHVRAYATHVTKERHIFDVKALHLGHFAKAFALRDRPGSMGRGKSANEKQRTIRPDKSRDTKSTGKTKEDKSATTLGQQYENARPGWRDSRPNEAQDAATRMRLKMKEHMSSAGEFNIG